MITRRRVAAAALAAPWIGSARAGVVVKDHAGRDVEIRDASRVVAIGGAVTETVYALDAGARLVGVDTTSLYPHAARALPQVGYMRAIGAEGVLSLRPSLVISTTAAGPPAAFAQLRDAGVATLVLAESYDAAGVVAKIDAIGRALGRDAAAAALIERNRAEMARLDARLERRAATPRTLFLLSIGQGPAQAAGRETSADGLIRLAGGANVAGGAYAGYRPVTAEGALSLAPEVIVVTEQTVAAMGGVDGVLDTASLRQTPAGRDRRVVPLDAALLAFGPRTPAAVRWLASRLHPGLDLAAAP